MSNKVKDMCMTAMGLALFVALAYVIRVPVFENYYICLGYVAMSVYCYSVGTFSGTFIGVIGVVIYCVLTGGLRGMPGWALGNLAIGLSMGLGFKYGRKIKSKALQNILYIIVIVVGTAIGMLGIKSGLESIIYAQPFLVRTANNIYAFVADAVVLLISLPVCEILHKHVKKVLT